MNDAPTREVWISYVEVHTDEDVYFFDEGTPIGLTFHDELVHVSFIRDGTGYNHFFPLVKVNRVLCREVGFHRVPHSVDLIQPR